MLFLIVVALLLTKNMSLRNPGRKQSLVELGVGTLLNMLDGIMGHGNGKKYAPFLGSMFLIIIASNYSGLLPGAGMYQSFMPPTNTLSVTLGLAICTFFASHYYGIKEKA